MKLSYYPLAPGSYKYFSSPLHSFWCCTGTGAEEFARFSDSIYFHAPGELYVNLYIASRLKWADQGLILNQATRFPEQDVSDFKLQLTAPTRLRINLRIPSWTAGAPQLWINDQLQDVSALPGSYLSIERLWHDKDHLRLQLPMQLKMQPLPGDDAQFALLYGPITLAAELPGDPVTPSMQHCGYWADPKPAIRTQPAPMPVREEGSEQALDWLRPLPGQPLHFTATASTGALVVRPLNQILSERYAVYWRTADS